jgi:hypothetical protein
VRRGPLATFEIPGLLVLMCSHRFLSSTAFATPSDITPGCDREATPSHSEAAQLVSAYRQPACAATSQALMAKSHNLTQTCKQVIHSPKKFFLQMRRLFCKRGKNN